MEICRDFFRRSEHHREQTPTEDYRRQTYRRILDKMDPHSDRLGLTGEKSTNNRTDLRIVEQIYEGRRKDHTVMVSFGLSTIRIDRRRKRHDHYND